MEDAQFWTIVSRAKSEADGDSGAFAAGVTGQLIELPPAEIASFDAVLWSKLNAAYTWKLWAAAYLINGGCSDDGFLYFRCWLISQGQRTYEAAVADPDALTKIADPDSDEHECEDLLGVAADAYEQVTDKSLPAPPLVPDLPTEPSGERWDFDDADATAKRLPRLSRQYNE